MVKTCSGAEMLECGVNGGDATIGSSELGTFLFTGSVATDGYITGSPNKVLSKIAGNECSISTNCDN